MGPSACQGGSSAATAKEIECATVRAEDCGGRGRGGGWQVMYGFVPERVWGAPWGLR